MSKKTGKLTLEEQRHSIQDAMIKALAYNNMDEYHRLNRNLIYVENKIEKEKKNEEKTNTVNSVSD